MAVEARLSFGVSMSLRLLCVSLPTAILCHRRNNWDIYNVALLPLPTIFHAVNSLHLTIRRESASKILAIIIFTTSYCNSGVKFISMSPKRITWHQISMISKENKSERETEADVRLCSRSIPWRSDKIQDPGI